MSSDVLADLLSVVHRPVAPQHIAREAIEPLCKSIALGIGLAGHQAGMLKRAQDAQHGGLGQTHGLCDLGQLGRTLVLGERFQDTDGAQDGRPGRYVIGIFFRNNGAVHRTLRLLCVMSL